MPDHDQQYLSDLDIATRLGVSRITVWRWTDAGRFPRAVKLGPNCTRWRRHDVEAWEAQRIAESEARHAGAGANPA